MLLIETANKPFVISEKFETLRESSEKITTDDLLFVITDVILKKYMDMLEDYMEHNYDLSNHEDWGCVFLENDHNAISKKRENGYFTITLVEKKIAEDDFVISIVGVSPGLDEYLERPLLNIFYDLSMYRSPYLAQRI